MKTYLAVNLWLVLVLVAHSLAISHLTADGNDARLKAAATTIAILAILAGVAIHAIAVLRRDRRGSVKMSIWRYLGTGVADENLAADHDACRQQIAVLGEAIDRLAERLGPDAGPLANLGNRYHPERGDSAGHRS